MADIRTRVGGDLDRIETRYQLDRHKAIESTLQDIIRERVLDAEAKRQKKSVEELIMAESGGSLEPNEVEIAAWYKENQNRTGGRTLDQVRSQIADLLRNQRRKEATEKLKQRLDTERRVTVLLEPYRLALSNEGAPAKGPANAAVTLVEFSDFQCPFCGRFFPTLKRIEESYGNRIRIVYRQYPLTSLHPFAYKAAEASLCANDQGKFWEMHDLMFQEQDRIDVRNLKIKAGRIGLDQRKFDACLDSGRQAERVQADLAEGARVGVDGTPALFLNGVPVPGGAVPYETVARAIDKELTRTKQ